MSSLLREVIPVALAAAISPVSFLLQLNTLTGKRPIARGAALTAGGIMRDAGWLQPAAAPEGAVQAQADDGHHRQHDRVTEAPAQFRQVAEVHPVDPGQLLSDLRSWCPWQDSNRQPAV